jgi:hypothetical protein
LNIGHLMRAMLADAQLADPKALELKVGQIVKGIVLQLIADQEALVNINGVHVRAKLETPLQQGQATLLQVQPESDGGQVVLRPLSQSAVPISQESMPDLLRSLGLKDSPASRQIVQLLLQHSLPVTKSNVQQMLPLMQSIPEGMPAGEWTQAAFVAFQRGLPLTNTVVHALHRTIFGMPMHEQLSSLEQEISRWVEGVRTGAGPGSSSSAQGSAMEMAAQRTLADKLLGLIAGLRSMSSGIASSSPSPMAGNQAAAGGQQTLVSASSTGVQLNTVQQGRPSSGTSLPIISSDSTISTNTGSSLSAANTLGHSSTASASSVSNTASVAGVSIASSPQPLTDDASAMAGLNRASSTGAQQAEAAEAGRHTDHWIPRLLKAVGLDHENQAAKLFARLHLSPANEPLTGMLHAPSSAVAESSNAGIQESIKSLLLQMQGMDDLPAAVKDQVQQTLQQITGQQLLLQADRGQAFTHLTLFIPILHGQDGTDRQTSAVHIQSRRSKNGALDAENCRLLFDLRMRAIGDTVVDVQIMNKRVSLVILNDHPAVAAAFDMYKDELAKGLEKSGYRFLSMKCQPYPVPVDFSSGASKDAMNEAWPDNARAGIASHYQVKTYKGVDLRV